MFSIIARFKFNTPPYEMLCSHVEKEKQCQNFTVNFNNEYCSQHLHLKSTGLCKCYLSNFDNDYRCSMLAVPLNDRCEKHLKIYQTGVEQPF